jgi:uncharacterized protein YodC (DUF2158 family)
MTAFSAGDVVKLKSGGPAMTIRWVEVTDGGTEEAYCEWFVKDENKGATFATAMFEKFQK